jgi:hypothetical protein
VPRGRVSGDLPKRRIMSIPSAGDIYIPTEEGYFVNQKWADLAEMIAECYPTLRLMWIPPDRRRDEDRKECYAIVDTHETVDNKPILYASEQDTPEDVLVRLWAGDTHKVHPLKLIDMHNEAIRALQAKRLYEDRQEAMELAKFMLSDRNYITMKDANGNLVKYDEYRNKRIING